MRRNFVFVTWAVRCGDDHRFSQMFFVNDMRYESGYPARFSCVLDLARFEPVGDRKHDR
jgi:hypothetical protein